MTTRTTPNCQGATRKRKTSTAGFSAGLPIQYARLTVVPTPRLRSPTAGPAAVAGNEIGVFCWALAAGAGLTALLRASAVLFAGLHVTSAAVLICLGVTAWRSARREDGELGTALRLRLPAGRTPAASFRASLVTIAANPKAAVFAFSFFVLGTAVTLAAIQVALIDGPYCAMIVLLASRASNWLCRAATRRRLERVLGAALAGLGIDLAAATR